MDRLKYLNTNSFAAFQAVHPKALLALLLLLAALALPGCQGVHSAASPSVSEPMGISGAMYGGQQPITGASVQVFTTGTGGDGSAATPLLTQPVMTNNFGSFSLSGLYQCPTPASQVYLVGTGGNPGLGNGGTNPQISMIAAMGPCQNLKTAAYVNVNEVTTVAAVFALAPYMQTYNSIGSTPVDAQAMADAFTMATELANSETGSTPGTGVPTGQIVPSQKLITLADILSTCVNSSGGIAGDSSACGLLFSLASAATGVAPTDTVGALLEIAQTPAANVAPIYDLNPPKGPFEPSLPSPPTDWTLTVTSPTPSPTFSPAPGAYSTAPSITLSDGNPSAAIYYTVDGTPPASSSIPYGGSIALSGTTTVRAIAIANGVSSLLAAGTYIIGAPIITMTPTTVTLGPSQTQAFTATVTNASSTAVTWSFHPRLGSITASGVYTAPASFNATPTITVTATSVANPAVSASATVSLGIPTLSVSSSSLAFGNVVVNTPVTQALTLTSAGTAPVTISAAAVTGAGFTDSGATFPVTLNPGQMVTLVVQFDPAVTGSATGQLTITSTSSANGSAIIGLSGTGEPHEVDLSWSAPASSADPLAGYDVYRSSDGGNTYQLLNSSADTATTYADTTVAAGLTYDYIVESVDASGFTSLPSNMISVTIP
jgi:hypothetical protein